MSSANSPNLYFDETHDSGISVEAQTYLNKILEPRFRDSLNRTRQAMEEDLLLEGITDLEDPDLPNFGLYSNVDPIPRMIPDNVWSDVERGVRQRANALNLFLRDVYSDQKILKAGLIPRTLVVESPAFDARASSVVLPRFGFAPLWGFDLVRTATNEFYVLEENVRSPACLQYISWMRELTDSNLEQPKQSLITRNSTELGVQLRHCLRDAAGTTNSEPVIALLSSRKLKGSFIEHAVLAKRAGLVLADPTDLVITEAGVFLKTLDGFKKIDVLYRRFPDFLQDDLSFIENHPQHLGRTLNDVVLRNQVRLVNPIGAGIACDKAIYKYVPQMISFYLNEDPIIKSVPTYICSVPEDLKFVLENLGRLVTKPRDLLGGSGVLIGPSAGTQELETRRDEILKNPDSFIAQQVVPISTCARLVGDQLENRHVDLRVFAFCGEKTYVPPGALSRVAAAGTLVTNLSQGGAMKDTWIVRNE